MPKTIPWLSDVVPLSPRGLDVDTADRLRNLILSGRLAAGNHLVEVPLAERLNVSRGVLRAAFQRLHEEGLVEYRANRGVFVRQLTAEDIWEIATLRDSLETMAAVLAARRITDEGRAELAALIDQMQAAVDAGDRACAVELDYAFHRLVMRLSGHQRLQRAYAVLEAQTRLFMVLTDPTHPDLSHMIPLHAPVAAAIARGDAVAAAELAAGQNEEDARALLEGLAGAAKAEPRQGAAKRSRAGKRTVHSEMSGKRRFG